jgi:hypothetical protein
VCRERRVEPFPRGILRKVGDRLVVERAPPRSLCTLLANLAAIAEDFSPISDPLPGPE